MENLKSKIDRACNDKTVLFCVVLSLLYMASGYWKWLEILVSITAFIFFILLPIQNGFCIFLFLHSFTLSKIGFDSCFIVTLIEFTLVMLAKFFIGIKKGNYTINKKVLISISIFFGVSILLSLPHKLYRGAWLYLTYFPLIYFFFEMRKEFDIRQLMNFMLGGLITSNLLAILSLALPYFIYSPFLVGRYCAFINHPNYLYMRALFVLTYYMYQYLDNDLKHWKFITIYLICSVIVLATLSKTGIGLLALFTFIFIILYIKNDFRTRIKIVGIFLVILGLILLASFNFLIEIWNRFTISGESIINTLLTGRDDIWLDYLVACTDNPLTLIFGHGLLTEEVYIQAQGITRASHSLYIFCLYRFGIVGSAFLAYIIYLLLKSINKQEPKFIAYLPLIWLLLESLVDNTFKYYHISYFILAGMILFSKCKQKPVVKNTELEEKIE